MKYSIEEIKTRKQIKEFHSFPKKLYKKEPNWICPLDSDIEGRFDPKVNELLKSGEAVRWLVRDENGQVVGRVAAFYNTYQVAKSEYLPAGGCGFFESINDQEVANMLFDAAKEWLQARGLEAMDGPINFGDRDQWWGLLTKGFEYTPLYTNPYNFEYYIPLFENYGFKNYFDQHTYDRPIRTSTFPESVYERVKRLKEDPGYRFEHIDKKNLSKYAMEFMTIYNKAWAKFSGVNPIDEAHAQALMSKMKPIIDEKLIYFAYYNDQPIGFFIMVPDLNEVIRPFNGKFGLFQKLRFLWRLKVTKKATRIFAIIFAVIPEFQGKGIESGMITRFEQELDAMNGKIPYNKLELAWVGDFNPLMMRMVETIVCAQKHKMHTTYRYIFDRGREFQRAPRMGVKKPEKKEA